MRTLFVFFVFNLKNKHNRGVERDDHSFARDPIKKFDWSILGSSVWRPPWGSSKISLSFLLRIENISQKFLPSSLKNPSYTLSFIFLKFLEWNTQRSKSTLFSNQTFRGPDLRTKLVLCPDLNPKFFFFWLWALSHLFMEKGWFREFRI